MENTPVKRPASFSIGERSLIRHTLRISLLAVVTAAFGHEGHRPLPARGMEVSPETGRMILTAAARDVLDVRTEIAATDTVSPSVLAYGTLVSPWNRHTMVSSPLSGKIVRLFVTPGESVKAGQKLAELDSPDLDLLQLELRTAKAAVDLSSRLVESMQEAGVGGAIPEVRFVEAKNRVEQDRARLEIAVAKWHGLQLPQDSLETLLGDHEREHVQRLTLRSPIDGIVAHTDLNVGRIVDPKEHLFEVLDLSVVWLKVSILEKDISRVADGQKAEVSFSAMPGKTFNTTIDSSSHYLDPRTHLGTVWTTLVNPPGSQPEFLPGMTGHVRIDTDSSADRLVIPMSAVIRNGAERFVLVEEERTKVASVFQKQTLVLGARTGKLIEVLGGNLYPGDSVVTRGGHQLGSYFAQGVLRVSEETARDIGLDTERAALNGIAETITLDGLSDVPPSRRTSAASQPGGSIAQILVDRGQRVRQGDILARVISQEFQNLQLELLDANLETRLLQSVTDSLRLASDAVSQRRLWESENQLRDAGNRRESALRRLAAVGVTESQRNALMTSGRLISSLPVIAPIDGFVVNFEKVLGQVVLPEEPLFEVHDLSQVWVRGFVSERDLSRIQPGLNVRVRFVGNPEEVVAGRLVRIGSSLEADGRTMSVWIELAKMPEWPLHHNMMARLTIETGRSTPLLSVPLSAVIRESARAYVFVRKDSDVFERRYVTTGRSDDFAVEIREGLAEGEVVAVRGVAQLQTGYAALR